MRHTRSRSVRSATLGLVLTAILFQIGSQAPVAASARPVLPAHGPEVVPLAAPTTEVPFQATGWKHLQVSQGGGPATFHDPAFDDSAWPTGQAAFGSGGGCSVQSTVNTAWSINTDLLLRRHVALAPGTEWRQRSGRHR